LSLNDILNSAMSGLAGSQAGLRTVSNNIANVSTPGYARERVTLSTGVSGGRVSGVVIGEPARIADKFLENSVYQRGGASGRAEITSSYYDRLQALLGAPDSSSGLAARLSNISASASEISLQGSTQSLTMFTGHVADTIDAINVLQKDVSNLRADVETELGFTIERVNVLLTQIHDLNSEVSRLEGLGRSTSGSSDRRMSALEELSTLVDITVREQPDGRVTIDTASGQVLLDRRQRVLDYPAGAGASQDSYPAIEIRFAASAAASGASTGERIESAAVGGKLGGLLDMRDRTLPTFSEQLGVLFTGLAGSLNAVSNASTSLPPPNKLTGEPNGLIATDRLGFTGQAVFAIAAKDGTQIQKTVVDFGALGPAATIEDAVAAINAGLGTAGSASYDGNKLTITATASTHGVAIAQEPTDPSNRAGVGFSQYFGLNNMVRSDSSALVPSGFTNSDPHGFAAGETTGLALRDASGKLLGTYTMTGSVGSTFGDLMTELNGSPLGAFGSFALDSKGRVQFSANATSAGATISIPSDSTSRYGTGLSFSTLSGLTGAASGLNTAEVRPDIASQPTGLPIAQLQLDAAIGSKAIGAGDLSGATAFLDQLAKTVDFGKDGASSLETFAGRLLGGAGAQASLAQTSYSGAAARFDDALNRRDSYSGVNVDEELAQMVVLQNSYSAAARVMTTASQMYDTLIQMLR
jgi:flagellar hook-associated protein 1 FlgK